MKIGQPFYKINNRALLATFNDHKFDTIFVLGIETDQNRKVLVECTKANLTIAQSLIVDRSPDGYILEIDYDADEFLKLAQEEQNNILFSQHGYVEDPETLRSEFNSLVEAEIVKERIKIQQWSDKIDEIEDSINNTTPDIFISKISNSSPVSISDTIHFVSYFYGSEVTGEVLYNVNGDYLEPGSSQFQPLEIGTYNVIATYLGHTANYSFEVI